MGCEEANEEGIAPLGKPRPTWVFSQLRAVGRRYGFDFVMPLKRIPKAAREVLLNGGGSEKFDVEYRYAGGRTVTYKHRFNGLLAILRGYYEDTTSNKVRDWIEAYMSARPCTTCGGGRLKPESLAIRIEDAATKKQYGINDVVTLSIRDAARFFRTLRLTERQTVIARQVLKEIVQRLEFLLNVGLDYLTLDRSARKVDHPIAFVRVKGPFVRGCLPIPERDHQGQGFFRR